MSNMRFPSRTAPTVREARNSKNPNERFISQQLKKRPPPRPPPPDFNKFKSKSAWNLNNQLDSLSLIDFGLPETPKPFVGSKNHKFGGSVSSSFSSSTSSLTSSKRSFEYESVCFDYCTPSSINTSNTAATQSTFYLSNGHSKGPAPTIIRPHVKKSQINKKSDLLHRGNSPPMPVVPPPSPPKIIEEIPTPYGLALYDYEATHKDDLSFKANDIIFLLRRINDDWLYGRIEEHEGMFPNNFISVQIPLPEDDQLVTALYEFSSQAVGDLALAPGQLVRVTGRVSADWLIGESNGCSGQFPVNFVDRIPSSM